MIQKYRKTEFLWLIPYINIHHDDKNDLMTHIILTDMLAPKPKPSKCQRMWMTTSEYAERPYFITKEKVVTVD